MRTTRHVFSLGFAGLLALATVVVAAAFPARGAHQEFSTGRFKVDIQGCASSADVVSVEVDDIEIEMQDVTQSNNQNWRTFTSAQPKFGEARFTFRTDDACLNGELRTWVNDTRQGRNIRKQIQISLLKRDGSTVGRTYVLEGTLPVAVRKVAALDLRAGATPPCVEARGCVREEELEQLVVAPDSIRMEEPEEAAEGAGHRFKGFAVEIKGVDGAPADVDSAWTAATGGGVYEEIEARSFTPGKQYVSDITLVGYMTPTRKALLTWMQNSAKGAGDLRADVSITPIKIDGSPAPAHNYYECLISRIKIPALNAGSSDPIKEVVVLRPTRYNDP